VQISADSFSPPPDPPEFCTAPTKVATHILVSLEAEPPTAFWTRRLASSVRSSSSWVRRSCLFLRR